MYIGASILAYGEWSEAEVTLPLLPTASDPYHNRRRGLSCVSPLPDLMRISSSGQVVLMRSRLKPDSTVIDVGANLGAITVPLAQAVPQGLVVSFEPQRVTNQVGGRVPRLRREAQRCLRRGAAAVRDASVGAPPRCAELVD